MRRGTVMPLDLARQLAAKAHGDCPHCCDCRMQGLWRPEAWGDVEVEVELLKWKAPSVQAPDVKLFDVPMAQQRYAFVLGMIRQHSMQSVVDLGCGEGKLLEYLLHHLMNWGALLHLWASFAEVQYLC